MSINILTINEWLNHRDFSVHTRRQYEREVIRFHGWLGTQRLKLENVSIADICNYLKELESELSSPYKEAFYLMRKKALRPSSRDLSKRTLHSFYEWAVKQKKIPQSPFWEEPSNELSARFTSPDCPTPPAIPVELKLLLQGRNLKKSQEYLRAAVIAHLAFWIGASRQEIAKLRIESFLISNNQYLLRMPAKNGSLMNIDLPKVTGDIILKYLACRDLKFLETEKSLALIASLSNHNPISGWSVRHILSEWQLRNIPEDRHSEIISPRQLKQCFQSLALQSHFQEGFISSHLRLKNLYLERKYVKHNVEILYETVSSRLFS